MRTIYDYDEIQRRFDNMRRVDAVVSDWKRTVPNDGWTIHLKCFNEDEAEELSEYMDHKYPGVPYFTSTVDFDRLGDTFEHLRLLR